MNIIFCTTVLPSRRRTGGEIASQAFIDAIRLVCHQVAIIGYRRPDDNSPIGLDENVVEIRPIETRAAGLSVFKWLLWSLIRKRPYSMQKYVSQSYRNRMREQLQRWPDAIVIIDHAQMAFLLKDVPLKNKVIFISHNVESELYNAKAEAKGSNIRKIMFAREAELIGANELYLAKRACQTWVLTRHDHDAFRNIEPTARICAFALPGHPSESLTHPFEELEQWDVGLIGTWTWEANRLGLQWFLSEVLPLLPPKLRIGLAGQGSESVDAPGVVKLGFVPDSLVFLRSCRLVCIPSISGGGVQIKTIDAIASGRPIVATPTALRGIETHPPTVTVCASAAEFAEAINIQSRQYLPTSLAAAIWASDRDSVFKRAVGESLMPPE